MDGERISYRALDVEQIGSVYETMMGFRLEIAVGRSVAVKAQKKGGAPTALDLDALLAEPPASRTKRIRDTADRKVPDGIAKAIVSANTIEDLHAGLLPIVDTAATPDLVPQGAMVLQPSQERRRSGSHYTPRTLTHPIVETALAPILERLRGTDGRPPKPAKILDLKICDPAMGSGAFLVEACRQLGDELQRAWHYYHETPDIPPDEDEIIYARRLVAQRCLYGVDRNPLAVDLSKVSLWLVTLARDHALTFVDHALRHGDSLVGLSRRQIEAFHWDESKPPILQGFGIRDSLDKALDLRREIMLADESVSDKDLARLWDESKFQLDKTRLYGDLAVSAFFSSEKPKEREAKREEYVNQIWPGKADQWRGWLEERRHADPPLAPFHWEIEFPEVFERENPGFDVIVGNPPFAGRTTAVTANVEHYLKWLQNQHEKSHGNSDLVAHFFRRAFHLLRERGSFGLISTNTIAQGDTRTTGLQWICSNGGEIYSARKRVKWPGLAAVVVSIVHVTRGAFSGIRRIDGRTVEKITAYLVHRGGSDDPAHMAINESKSFQGCVVVGMGFTFDDSDQEGVTTPISEMQRLLVKDARNKEVIFPYMGGAEFNASPTQTHNRYIINFGDRDEQACRRRWPDLVAIVEAKVRSERHASLAKSQSSDKIKRARNWWQFSRLAKDLYSSVAALEKVLAISRVGEQAAFAFARTGTVWADSLVVFPLTAHAAFCTLQARPHEIWARFFGSSMKDDLRYTPSDCFETFPFPEGWETHPALEGVGKTYYEFRAALMVRNNEGLTKTYNRFHDPEECDAEILKLRELHAAMDRAVLDAYGWNDIPTTCEFLLDFDIDEEEWGDKKKPLRYRWPDDTRDEVLARLLELNARRALEESLAGAAASGKRGRKTTAKKSSGDQKIGGLFE